MSEPKKYIYLQWYDEDGEPLDPHNDEVTWSQDNIYGSGVAYTRSDLVEAAIDQARAEDRDRILRAIDDAQEHARIRYRSDATIDVLIDELGALADAIRSMGSARQGEGGHK